MNRRRFYRTLAAAAGGVLLAPSAARAQAAELLVNGGRLLRRLRELAAFGRTPEGGIDRVAFSEADRGARAYVLELMRAAGLSTEIDAAGNLVGRRRGTDPTRAPLMIGSHIDSVPHGGNYDGQVGALGAAEVTQTLTDHAIALRHPLEVVIFSNEEGGKTGSRAMAGEVAERELDLVTASGRTIREGIAFVGGDPSRLDRARRRPGAVAAFLELHVEQGGVLERDGIAIGVVRGIVGIKRWTVVVEGFANHAGTTPMDARRDALVAAARFVDAVHVTARETPGRQVATVGRIAAEPGAPNVIPGRVTLSLEIRDLEMAGIERLLERLQTRAAVIGRETGTAFAFDQFYVSRAAPTDERLRRLIADAAAALGLSTLSLPSGAGHDAQSIATFAPVGMIFVPSVDGISHSPREFTHPEDVVHGANVLLHALLRADALDFG